MEPMTLAQEYWSHPLTEKACPTPHLGCGRLGSVTHMRGMVPAAQSEQPRYHQTHIWGFELALPKIYPMIFWET